MVINSTSIIITKVWRHNIESKQGLNEGIRQFFFFLSFIFSLTLEQPKDYSNSPVDAAAAAGTKWSKLVHLDRPGGSSTAARPTR